jgi:glutamine amidotransferase
MKTRNVTIIDYGMGNIWSVVSALEYLNCKVLISSNPNEILSSETLILPGVGSFRKAMLSLQSLGLDKIIYDSVESQGNKILGICLGMQILGNGSTEDGEYRGIGLINSNVEIFTSSEVGNNKVPHTGFNTVFAASDSVLFKNLPKNPDFYFVHSYRMLAGNLAGKSAKCNYGIDFLAAYEEENIFATQFHPEKSQTNGLILLKNFLEA